jgi:2,3-bisphosphoglycerate-independent phosphoglycerate mutase
VTYFFNGGEETEYPGEVRKMIPSPLVATFDKAPEMAAKEVTKAVIDALNSREYSLIVVNYANPDMVGHTGKMPETIKAVEAVDRCLGRLVDTIGRVGATAIITAEQGNPWTAHTTNQVPFILVEGEKLTIPGYGAEVTLRENGKLADIAPTILQILSLPQPPEMTGISMIMPAELELSHDQTPMRVGV